MSFQIHECRWSPSGENTHVNTTSRTVDTKLIHSNLNFPVSPYVNLIWLWIRAVIRYHNVTNENKKHKSLWRDTRNLWFHNYVFNHSYKFVYSTNLYYCEHQELRLEYSISIHFWGHDAGMVSGELILITGVGRNNVKCRKFEPISMHIWDQCETVMQKNAV